MSFLETIRRKRGMKELHRLYDRHRRVKQMNWDQVKTVGILYNATSPQLAATVKEFFRQLQSEGKQPHALGYVHVKDEKQVPAAAPGLDYFSRKDLDGKLLPVSSAAKQFIETPFDILFDLDVEQLFPLYAASHLSRAHLKAGLDIPSNRQLNLTIQLDTMQQPEALLKALIGNLVGYVREIRV
jgi:hypothetical protein